MQSKAPITIIIAIYNVDTYLNKCLFSIKEQTFSDFVCYCVNDGSTDNSESIINKYLTDPRFKKFNKTNGGLSDARNYGLKEVNTNYDNVLIRMPKGKKEQIKAFAEQQGESLNGFINRAIDEAIERESGGE